MIQDGRNDLSSISEIAIIFIHFVYTRRPSLTPTFSSSPNNAKSCWLGYVVAVVRKKPAEHAAIDLLYDKHEEHFQHLPTCSKLHDVQVSNVQGIHRIHKTRWVYLKTI